MNSSDQIKNQFNSISPAGIIEYCNKLKENSLYSKKPEEVLKTDYKYGQTIILKGDKMKYENLTEFWLASQAWYSDGEDSCYSVLIFDNLASYKDWQSNLNRVGICKEPAPYKLTTIQKRVDFFLGLEILIALEMDSTWNNNKVLFTDGNNYFLYYFWTGE